MAPLIKSLKVYNRGQRLTALDIFAHRAQSCFASAVQPHRGRYTVFPATLLHLCRNSKSDIFAYRNKAPSQYVEDAVQVSEDGFVYLSVSNKPPYGNGPLFMPNTCFMQELVRGFAESKAMLGSDDQSFILRIVKGTPLPSTLALVHEYSARFSLQPAERLSLANFNQELDRFYRQTAERIELEHWLDQHDYGDALDDLDVASWMAY